MNLYEISSDLERLDQILSSEVLTEEQKEELEKIKNKLYENLHEKIDGIGFIIQKKNSEIDIIKEEINRLNVLKKQKENAVAKLKKYLVDIFQCKNIKKIETALHKFYLKGNPEYYEYDIDLIPFEYISEETVLKINKDKIKKDINNKKIPGVTKKEKTNSIIIK